MAIILDGYTFPAGEEPFKGPLITTQEKKWVEQHVLGNVASIMTLVGTRNQVMPMTSRASTATKDKLQEIYDARKEVVLKTNQDTAGFRVLMTKLVVHHKTPIERSRHLCKFTLENREAANEASSEGSELEEDLPTIVLKTANQTVNNSTTLIDDDELLLPLAVNEIWVGTAFLQIVYFSGSDFKLGFTKPSGCQSAFTVSGAPSLTAGDQSFLPGSSVGPVSVLTQEGGNPTHTVLVHFLVKNGGTAGVWQLQWAQNAAVAENTVVSGFGSYIMAHKQA